jgi:hypothetical protein
MPWKESTDALEVTLVAEVEPDSQWCTDRIRRASDRITPATLD